jgi:hypothetical protein
MKKNKIIEPTIKEKIIQIVDQHNGIRAKDIAIIMNLERKEVNSVLSQLDGEGKCYIDDDYCWVLRSNNYKITPSAQSPKHKKKRFIPKQENTEIVVHDTYRETKDTLNVSPTKMKRPVQVPYIPASAKAEDLFEYAVKHLAQICQDHEDIFEPKMHNQWYNYCFGNIKANSSTRSEYMSLIKSRFNVYFTGKYKYTFDIEAIERDFPQFFGGNRKKSANRESEMVRAVKSELEFAQKPQNKEKYKVACIEREKKASHIYRITLDLKGDDEPHFYEGIKITLLVERQFFDCVGLDYDSTNAELSVSSEKELVCGQKLYGQITLDTTFILEAVYEMSRRIETLDLHSRPIRKFLKDNTSQLKAVSADAQRLLSLYGTKLDDSQKDAFLSSINNDITFIWGPPGTGKSYTLASVIRALYARPEQTIVCCISNVAVDQLLSKVVDLLEAEGYKPETGNFYRAGYTTVQRLLDTNYLFPIDGETKRLRDRITAINVKLQELQKNTKSENKNAQELVLRNERIEAKEKLKDHTEFLVNSSKVVFSTIAGFILTKQLCERHFDNLVVDEASMLSMPYLFAIAQKITKRIILVGDPQQLGPISITPNRWMRENVFDHCNVLEGSHPALKQLLIQRRSHANIVCLTNDVFYQGKLVSVRDERPKWVEHKPFAGKIVAVVNPESEDNEVKYVGKTRRNFGTKEAVMKILTEYCNHNDSTFSIGVITPYRGQVKMYIADIRERYNGSGFWENIKVGTIHTFQGSECDLILLDLVEKRPVAVGKLFCGEDGERLINVALSRAKYKLIIVGDTMRFGGGAGIANVSDKVSKVLSRLR